MRTRMVSSTVCGLVLLMSSAASAQVSVGVSIGHPAPVVIEEPAPVVIEPPPPPRTYSVAPRPSPEFVWVEGYWYPQGHHYSWHDGYWTRPPYAGAYWVAPYYARGAYVSGYWGGPRGRFDHDHRWDNDRDRRDEWRERHEEREERSEHREHREDRRDRDDRR